MFAKPTIAAAALLVSLVAAQSNSTIDPDSISITERTQMTTCSTLCQGSFAPEVSDPNDCYPNNLTYTCSCANGSEPGLQYYTTSLPTFICEAVFAACNLAGTGQKATQDKCKANEEANCGHLDVTNFTAGVSVSSSSSSSSAAPTATSASGDATPTATSTTSTSSGAAATMMALGGEYGTGMVAAGVAAAFGLLL